MDTEKADLLQGTLDMLILKALQLEPMHGFGLAQRLKQMPAEVSSEAASAILTHARTVLKLGPLLAVTAQENPASIKLLQKLGFKYERLIDVSGYVDPSRLFLVHP